MDKPAELATVPRFTRKRVVGIPDLTDEILDKIAEALAGGASATDAALLVGIMPVTYRKWLQRGREAIEAGDLESELSQLAITHDAAQAHYRKFLVDVGNKAASNRNINTNYIKWRLAMSQPSEFGSGVAEATGGAFAHVTPQEALAGLREKLARLLAPPPTPPAPAEPTP
jgi:hypothetical protein